MAYSEAGSSSDAAQASRSEYEVFLSFRGSDTRHGFADFLYHGLVDAGVHVFKEDDELRVGEVIGENLQLAIKNSQLYIPIFSRTYAFSKWCLRELSLIVDNMSTSEGEKSILPIFFDVDSEDVKLKTPLYRNALLKHEKKFPLEVKAWRAALSEVGKIKGWNWKKDQSQAMIVKSVVEKVLEKLEIKQQLVTEHLVGLDDRIKDLIELLDVNHDDVRLIEICGMGGIGKTTIAKVVFNQLSSHFGECCCFWEDVQQSSSTKEGIVPLQKKLLSDIGGFASIEKIYNSEEGRIGATLSNKKVLLILDDVDRKVHIKNLIGNYSLHSGSRIIITTKDKTIPRVEGFNGDIRQYEIPKMDDALALQLFCWHAFDRDTPLNDYQELSSKIVSTTGRLPLAIKVIGSLLKGKDKAFWEEKLARLRNVPEYEIPTKLKISYDDLDENQKRTFLDIAIFFFNEKKTHASYMVDSCRFDPTIGIDVLIERCLIKVLDNGKFWMHDQLIALGMQIVHEASLYNLGKRGRLWIVEDSPGKLTRRKKLKLKLNMLSAPLELASLPHPEVPGLRHLYPKPLVQLPSTYCSWRNLSTLKFYQCEVEAIPLERLPQLVKLTVDGCKQLEKISIPLELRKLCQAWVSRCPELVEIQVVGHSKSLNSLGVSWCKSLIRIDGLSYLKNLEELVIQRCNVLTNVQGLHDLESLKSLVVKKCTSLRWLIDASCTYIPDDCLVEIWGCGDFVKQGTTSLKRYREEILLDTSNKRMKKIEDEAREQAADMETLDRNYAIAAVQNVVGIDDRVKEITDLLEMEVNDEVRIIGIYGTDGIGKTTLAKALYKRISSCFDSCSFLAEVEETTQNSSGIQFLRTKLIRDILERDREDPSFDERIEDFLDIFREMKVLIVVDEVEEQSHLHAIVGDRLHWFGPGSRIIVTSKNGGILKGYDLEKARNYIVSELDDGQAFELFCKHAFRMQSSKPDYDGFSNRIVNATEKLPLAVEVVGSFLRGKSIQEWKKMEKSMKECMMSSQKTKVGLEEILDICYKALDQQQKDIFLDIACFISGVDARIASSMWPNRDLPSSDCFLMPLAKIGENNELQMHRLLRCLGKRILNQEGSGDPSGRKLYILDMVPKAISREKGMENVEALCFHFKAGDFQSMPDTRILKLNNAKVSGNFEGAFASLRWLCWQRCPLEFDAFNFVLRELVILDLSWSKVTEDWGGWSTIKMGKLEVLNLTGCSDLLFTPDFSGYKDLKILILEGCSRLVKLHPSIGHLKRLVSLNLKFCSQLNGLPVELGCVTALKELFIDGTSVRQIPISIGNLKQLEILSGFKCFALTHLPSSISYLTALSELSLDGAKISELPSSLGELLKLRRLSLRDCRYLEKLPYSIGEMGLLEELDISATSISELSDSIRNLKSLKVLRMDSSFIRAFPGEIGNLTKLEELHASWCRSLKGAIPGDIKGLRHLRSLTLGHSSISSLPPEISTIPGLHTLDLIQCNEIEELPKLPPSLICLRVSSKRMKAITVLEDLKELEELCLSDGDPKAGRPPSGIEEIEGLEGLKALKRLDISNCKIRILNGIGQLTSLRSLILSDCDHLSSLDLSCLKSLKVLEIRRCKTIHQIEGIEKLTSLKKLKISECPAENSVLVQNALKDVRARSTVT